MSSAIALNIKKHSSAHYTLSVSHLVCSYVLLMLNALKCLGLISSIPFIYKYISPQTENSLSFAEFLSNKKYFPYYHFKASNDILNLLSQLNSSSVIDSASLCSQKT